MNFENATVGDLVLEVSTFHMHFGSSPRRPGRLLDNIGVIEEIAHEPVAIDGVWNEEEEGQPRPLEIIRYLRTLDGRRFRWSNAMFIKVPTETTLPIAPYDSTTMAELRRRPTT
jgi:hypothetical protein